MYLLLFGGCLLLRGRLVLLWCLGNLWLNNNNFFLDYFLFNRLAGFWLAIGSRLLFLRLADYRLFGRRFGLCFRGNFGRRGSVEIESGVFPDQGGQIAVIDGCSINPHTPVGQWRGNGQAKTANRNFGHNVVLGKTRACNHAKFGGSQIGQGPVLEFDQNVGPVFAGVHHPGWIAE